MMRLRRGHLSVVAVQRIFGEASEKNLYLSQLIILDTLEKCLAGVSLPPRNGKSENATGDADCGTCFGPAHTGKHSAVALVMKMVCASSSAIQGLLASG